MDLDKIKPKQLGEIPGSPENIKVKDFRPLSVFNSPVTNITKAKYPLIDIHAHAWQRETDIGQWVNIMNDANIEKAIILSFETGNGFDEIIARYAAHSDKFDIWCGFDYTGYDKPGSDWIDNALAELESCHKKGAKGVGELGDKGLGEYYSSPVAGYGMHLNDPCMKPLLKKSGQLGMPVSIHVSDPIWMYLPMDNTNDGLMNAYNWRIEMKEGMLNHSQLLFTLEDAVQQNPDTVFIACHLANCTHDLQLIAKMLDKYPNLYTDITSRLKEVCTVPRYAKAFFEEYQDRILYGSDLGYDPKSTMQFAEKIYSATFRLLESEDDHIYEHDLFKYHWPLYGLNLSDEVLNKLYYKNAANLIGLNS